MRRFTPKRAKRNREVAAAHAVDSLALGTEAVEGQTLLEGLLLAECIRATIPRKPQQ